MNGSRSPSPRPGSSSSLDALSRTIEGLEARIEGLMTQSGARVAAPEAPARPLPRSRPEEPPRRVDPLAEIRQRQKALEESRARGTDGGSLYSRGGDQPVRAPVRTPPLTEPRPGFSTRSEARTNVSLPAAAAPRARDMGEPLNGLRQDLRQDVAETISREIAGLRSEMRAIRAMAEEQRPQDDLRADLARLADSIQQLDSARTPGSDGLRQDFDALRSLMDGLAREETVQRMEQRWSDVEVRLDELDTGAMRDEIIRLADRLDDIKAQLGSMSDSRTIRALEDKLMTVASALEHIGAHVDPNERMVMEQFAGLDLRLDEITRAIAANSRASGPANDPATFHRLEDRLVGLARQIETLSERRAPEADVSQELAERLELLTVRIEQLSAEQGAVRLEERLDQLSYMLERGQTSVPAPELTGYLADISRKIDALDSGAVNDRLADRLEILARRIEDLDAPHAAAVIDDSALRNLEDRLNAVVDRLEETSSSVPGSESASLRGLEEQIAHLSALISQPSTDPEVTGRISALEDYVATSDEYIIEAARQAAETVMANFSQRNLLSGTAQPADLSALTALSEHLKQLEDYSRHSEERTHRTFEALHDTLVQIAGRLDELHESSQRQDSAPMFAQAPIAAAQPSRPAEPMPASASVKPPEMPAAAASHPVDEELLAAADDFAQTMTAMPVIDAAREKKASKPSLLAGLGKKLMPSKKAPKPAQPAKTEGREVIEPAPSIDPVDVLPPDEANELLEPGSGAPDVRKILERVRASQQASKSSASDAETGDRTDYIAAARRAAQAAAMEMNKTQKASPAAKATAGKSAGKANAKVKMASEPGQPSLFARYRRPILMAVGAILLAAMAMPLVNTLTKSDAPVAIEDVAPEENTLVTPAEATNSDSVSQAAPVTEPVAPEASETAALTEPPAEAPAPAVVEPAVAPVTPAPEPVTITAAAPATPPVNALMAPAETGPAQTLDNRAAPANASAQPPAPSQPAAVVAATAPTPAAPAAEIVVPAEITPPSLSIAAKNGDPLALFEIGARYTEGRGVANNFAEAAKWYKLSADKGFALAQYRLANFLEKGTGLAPDIKEAKRYYEMAAASGNASAMHNLAVIYASGKDGAQDYAKAVEWFGKAAERGVSDSQFNLAILYARGNGAAPDLTQSYKWFAIAAKGGDKDAAQKRDEVANAMKPDQLERARAEVDLWKVTPLDPDANSANTPDEWAGKGLKTASIDMKKAIRNIQAILNKNGFDAGNPDGVMGAKTVTAIKAFQTSIGEEPNGQVSDKLVKELLARNK
ncbi:peptidoglycan-binding protein [Rhizobium sp. Root274]|uniref:SEL1-like repeat protein n=1 Tax=unclassified Rhizobium TaxID=2613769 RepID=UPI00071483CD|nr:MULTISPECIES: SEL1-like repeat protein [unclassified Rhizobium]KQW31816.1 peptidoglycan-binding protein [Rhizobium sp. Root1240]KRD33356.1 peptidoglycan-binding protein [Rhizobium sp. Root274]